MHCSGSLPHSVDTCLCSTFKVKPNCSSFQPGPWFLEPVNVLEGCTPSGQEFQRKLTPREDTGLRLRPSRLPSALGCRVGDLPLSPELGCLGWASAPTCLLCGGPEGSAHNTQPSVVAPLIPVPYTLGGRLCEIRERKEVAVVGTCYWPFFKGKFLQISGMRGVRDVGLEQTH